MDPREPADPRDAREGTGSGRPVPVGGRGSDPPARRPPEREGWPGDEHPAGEPESRVDLSGLRKLSENPPPVRPERPGRDGALPRMVAFFIAAVIFALVPWYFFTKVLRDDQPSKPPAATTTRPTPTPTPTPSPTATPGTYEVVTEAKCLNLRESPGTDQKKVTCLGKGLRVQSDGRTASAGGMEWLHVTYQKFEGWAAAQYLRKVG